MEMQKDDEFTFTWIIENFSMCHEMKGEYFYSPSFALNSLTGMKLRVELYPQDNYGEDQTAFHLIRKDDLPENCIIKCRLQLLNDKKKLLSCFNEEISLFTNRNGSGYERRIAKNYSFRSLPNDVLIIKYNLKPVRETNQNVIPPPLPYKNGLFTDVVLRARNESFKVHKAILWARWPTLAESLDKNGASEQVFDITADVLEVIIKYVYTGKIDFTGSELLPKVYTFAAKYELHNLSFLPVMAMKARTRINTEKICFDWPIESFYSLPANAVLHSHVFTVAILPSCGWNVVVTRDFVSDCHLLFSVSIYKVYGNEQKTVLCRSTISYVINNNIFSSGRKHLFQKEEKWQCAVFSVNPSRDREKVLLLMCEFKFSNPKYSSEILETACCFPSSINCPYFNHDLRNLFESGNKSDLNIVVDRKAFVAHKFILCARSSVFSRMFETEMIESKSNILTISDMEPEVIREMLLFMYCGCLEIALEKTAIRLYIAADKYAVFALKEKCCAFLKDNLSVRSVCEVVQLAYMHSDEDLHNTALAYFLLHAMEIFLTEEWKEIASETFWVTLLENVAFLQNDSLNEVKL